MLEVNCLDKKTPADQVFGLNKHQYYTNSAGFLSKECRVNGIGPFRPKYRRTLRNHQSGGVRTEEVPGLSVTRSQNQELPPFESHKGAVNRSSRNKESADSV